MSYSAPQLLAISGFSQNKGLQVSTVLLDRIAALQSVDTLSGKLRRVVTHPSVSSAVVTALRTSLPGLSLTVPASYSTVTAPIDPTDLTESIRARADLLMSKGPAGFLNVLGLATNASRTSREMLGALYEIDQDGFSGVAPDISSHTDLLTGGITSKFGPLAAGSPDNLRASGLYSGGSSITKSATDIQRSINAVADSIENLGTLYDFQSLETFGTPYGLIVNLLKQGLIKAEFINSFSEQGVTVNTLTTASDSVLTSILQQITGVALQKIVSGVALKVPSASVILNNAAELLEGSKVLSTAALNAIPGSSLKDLAKQLISMNVNLNSSTAIITALRSIRVPNTPLLNDLTDPVPAEDSDQLKLVLPTGSGDFNSALVPEIIGTASGHVHTAALTRVGIVVAGISGSTEGTAIGAAADALYAIYAAGGTVTTEETALINAVAALVANSNYTVEIETTNQAAVEIIDQLELELLNCRRGGVDVYSSVPGNTNTLLISTGLPSFGADPYNTGTADMLLNMLSNDRYGEAVRAVLLQGQNAQVLQSIGKQTIGVANVSETARRARASSGAGLTDEQRENVIKDARERGLDLDNAISNASLYGYNNRYYMSRGFPSAT
jgi:hypothetical protein